jgi:hypothetical protein
MASTFTRLVRKGELFAFFLFDSRQDQKKVESFVRTEFSWFDDLARSTRMYFFGFVRDHGSSDEDLSSTSDNPSLDVAKMFKIRPNQLPGIVLFTSEEGNLSHGVYLPLKLELFRDEASDAREVIADLFSLVQECREKSTTPRDLLQAIQDSVTSLKREQRRRPLILALHSALVEIGQVPKQVMMAAASAFGTALGGRVV